MQKVGKPEPVHLRLRIYRLLESEEASRASKALRLMIGLLIITNVVAVIAESHESFFIAHEESLGIFNVVSVLLFTIEYTVRLWVAAENPKFAEEGPMRARMAYALKGWGVIDLLAIAPFYLGAFVPVDLRFVRALRLLRLFKLSRHFKSLDIFWFVIRTQAPILLGATTVILILLILSSTMMYMIESSEQPDQFGSISQAMWWSIVTLTSVGYGDVVPATIMGKVTGGFIMFLGVGLVALPAAVLAGKFADELQIRRKRVERLVSEYLTDGEIDMQEDELILMQGHREGLSLEQTREITEGLRHEARFSRPCPKCGYSEDSNR